MAKLMKTAYYAVKMNMSYKNHENMVSLQRENGIDMGQMLFSEKAMKDMVDHIASKMRNRLLQKIKNDNMDISLMIDESTSVRQKTCLIIYIRLSIDGKGRNFFWKLMELKSTTSNDIARAVESSLEEFGEDFLKKHWIGLATDGASSLTGRWNGAGSVLKSKFNRIVLIHCLAHR